MAKSKAIVLDMDDTIVAFSEFLCRLHNSLNNTCITIKDLTSWDFGDVDMKDAQGNQVTGKDLMKTFHDYESHGLYAALPVIKDARFAIQLMQSLNYKVIIVTARKEEFQTQTILNTIHQKIPYDKLIFSSDKVKTIKELNKKYHIRAFADDKLSTVEAVSEGCKVDQCFLIDMPHNQNCSDEDIIRVDTLFEVVRYLKQA